MTRAADLASSGIIQALGKGVMPFPTDAYRDKPWLMRTYTGHSSAMESNALYLRNLAKGQTGLSVAFDLPTHSGYVRTPSWHGERWGKKGIPVSHLRSNLVPRREQSSFARQGEAAAP
jgi:methylmalonyl-CoA mutase N-terminal domain/subunit